MRRGLPRLGRRKLRLGWRRLPPPAVLALLYATVIIIGALALMTPLCATRPIGFIDALFTATSAITVTGLVVLDTGADFTHLGQAVIALLIQLGGLGLMSFAVMVAASLGLPVGLTSHLYLREDLNQPHLFRLSDLVRAIIRIALICELIGAALIAPSFIARAGLAQGLWEAAFHSVSAFNNAGFSTYSDGLVSFATDLPINLVIPSLFIMGGLGYATLREVARQRKPRHWSLNTKVMLLGTAVLIPWSVVMFAALEWNNPGTLGQFDAAWQRWLVAWFQGVTTRTAGFNTTDIGALHDSTSLMFISLMLIGGGPTSTAGGIKVTTFVVMLLATVAFFRRQTEIAVFGRSICTEDMLKATAIVAITVLICFGGVFLVVSSHDGDFMDVAFEVASAFGTVGLSRNYTGQLSGFGQLVIIAIMFVGRVGPLTLGFFLATRGAPRVRRPRGQIALG